MKRLLLCSLILCLTFGIFSFSLAAEETVMFQGLSFPRNAESIDFGNFKISSLIELETVLDQLPALKSVDMFATPVKINWCDELTARYPGVHFGWTLWIQGKDHSHYIRTDQTAFSTLHNNRTSHHTSEDFSILKYCDHLLALDVGHNEVRSLDFLYDLPELRVLIIACNYVEDITPIASLPDLEYAELFKNRIADISPVSGLKHILDLNICFNRIKDWSPVYQLHSLTRLWLYYSCYYASSDNIPKAEAKKIAGLLPNTQVDYTHYSTAGTWRKHPHYDVIFKMFESGEYIPFADSFHHD